MQLSIHLTAQRRREIVRIGANGVMGLAAGAFAASGIFDTFAVAPYWEGLWTGIICTMSTGFGAGFGLVYRPTF